MNRWFIGGIRGLRDRLAARPDTEHVMLLNKIVISTILMLIVIGYSGGNIEGLQAVETIYGLFIAGCILLFASLLLWPGVNCTRRTVAILLDAVTMGIEQYYGGLPVTGLAYAGYLLIIFGNASRFGGMFLAAAAAASIGGLSANVMFAPVWADLKPLGYGLVFGLFIFPAYAYRLVRDLTEARARAEESARAKSQFLASVSHEFRTPLNAVIGLGDLLAASSLPTTEASWGRTISVAGRSLLDQINSILDFSRLEAGQLPLGHEPFDVGVIARDVRDMLFPQAHAKGLGLGLHIHMPVETRIVSSPRHLRDALVNLVSNAIRFTPTGHVLMTISTIARYGRRQTLRFEVSDTGIGIEAGALERVFERFAQADETIVDRFGGTGLGLAIVKQLVAAMGGRVGVNSVVGRGSRFWFEAPFDLDLIAADHELAPPEASDQEDVQIPEIVAIGENNPPAVLDPGKFLLVLRDSAGAMAARALAARCQIKAAPLADTNASVPALKILVAEDNATNRMIVERVLTGGGHQVVLANDGQAALARLADHSFDLVLMDINMPVLNGLEASRRYREQVGDRAVPIIALTADATDDMRARCTGAGMIDCLTKPIEPTRLLEAIARNVAHDPKDSIDRPAFKKVDRDNAGEALNSQTLATLARLGGDDFVREILEQFTRDAADLLDAITAAGRRGDIRSIRDDLHALQSCATHVGADAICTFCRESAATDDARLADGVISAAQALRSGLSALVRSAPSAHAEAA